ncbi:MAG TPA: nucleoside diphosphate kinase regulator [Phycisphaerales bacterium]|nr:nucleoside diphosphate kinase regulator [Phycisphaerales bacterium]
MPNKKHVYITECDFERLSEWLDTLEKDGAESPRAVAELKKEMERARVVSPRRIDDDVVTMNSRILVKDMVTHEHFRWQIVFPRDANVDEGKISVLAPVGTGLLGYRVGDTVAWEVPGGVRRMKIMQMLYQPEAHGRCSHDQEQGEFDHGRMAH